MIKEIIEGLQIFLKYTGEFEIATEHDIIYAGPAEPLDVTIADFNTLIINNWFIDETTNSWAHFT